MAYTDNFDIKEVKKTYHAVRGHARTVMSGADLRRLYRQVARGAIDGFYPREKHGISSLERALRTAALLCTGVSADRNMIAAILLFPLVKYGGMTRQDVKDAWDDDILKLVDGLLKVGSLYSKQSAALNENFRNLLLTFATDIRVIILMIVDRVVLMKTINHHPDQKFVVDIATEASYLYAPLAHRLGLYKLKQELEDMSLKYTNREIYTRIAHKLNATKVARDRYIADFIAPVKAKLEARGLKFDIKGRTKSIYSIWNKMRKQNVDLDHIYDLFAIRIIIDAPAETEKDQCWDAFSIITNMYMPNPSRMKDWISIPKSNGYESLHITVAGPENRWVEVQIRSRRMDEVAEKGFAAHWKYKGIKAEGDLDAMMNNVRDILETAETGPMELMKNLQLNIYDKEVFVFTPKGDLYQLPLGATVLDFAFHIHSMLGCRCTGGRVDGVNQKIGYKLKSGDTVEILTSPNQQPRADWLNFVVTGKARTKIRQTLNEQENRGAELGKEMVQRRFKNRKQEIDDAVMSKLIKKLGYKSATDFYNAIGQEQLDVNSVFDSYVEFEKKLIEASMPEHQSASEFFMQPIAKEEETSGAPGDVLIIGEGIKGVNYRLAKCCNPIFGDEVFGFISSEGIIKVHRSDCPNAKHLKQKYGHRVINTKWSGKVGAQFAATLRIIGKDQIGIVTNISSLINKEKDVAMRNISIDAHDGLFHGYVVVGVNNTEALNALIRKLKTVKGVKDVERSK